MPSQHDIVPVRCRVKMTVSQDDAAPTKCRDNVFIATNMSCHHDTMPTRCRVNSTPCQHCFVPKKTMVCQHDTLSRRHRDKTTLCQLGVVSRRHRVKTVWSRHGVVSRRCRAKKMSRNNTIWPKMGCRFETVLSQTQRRLKTMPVSKHCRDNTVPCKCDAMSRRHRVKAMSCQHDFVSRR